MAVYTDQFDIANVVNYLNKNFSDQVFAGNPLFAKLNANGMKQTIDGGFDIREPLMTGQNATGGWMTSGYDELDFTPQAGVAYATYPVKAFNKTVVMSDLEQRQNSGGSKLIDLWEFKIEQAKLSAQDKFNSDLYLDGTAEQGAITGLAAYISATGTYAGINRATTGNEYWKAGYTDSTSETISENRMLTAFNTASQNGRDFPNLILTTRAIWQTYHGLLTDNVRYEDKEMANLGFKSLTWMGIPIVWDNDCPSGTMYFINTKTLKLRPLVGRDFYWIPKRQPDRQVVDAIATLWYGNLVGNAPRMNAVLTGKS